MEKEEVAEAIIVVGPYLWKCVNCNILMSRQHSIDQHLHQSHHSNLYSPDVLTLNDKNDIDCRISLCSCQNQSVKRKKQSSSKGTILAKKKKTLNQKQSDIVSDEEKEQSQGASNEFTESNEGCNKVLDSYVDGDMMEQFSMQSCDDITQNSVTKEVGESNPNANLTSGNHCSNNSNGEVGNGYSLSENSDDDLPVTIIKPKDKFLPSVIPHNDDNDNTEDAGVRKSRRSNKGKNTLYVEYEMNDS